MQSSCPKVSLFSRRRVLCFADEFFWPSIFRADVVFCRRIFFSLTVKKQIRRQNITPARNIDGQKNILWAKHNTCSTILALKTGLFTKKRHWTTVDWTSLDWTSMDRTDSMHSNLNIHCVPSLMSDKIIWQHLVVLVVSIALTVESQDTGIFQ